MRLIDADAVRRWLTGWQYGEAPTLIDNDKDREKAMLRYEILDIILSGLDDPYFTIEAEPVRHGKWVVAGNTTHYYICSVCGKPGDGFDIYCRSCGALMERPCDKCQGWDCYGCDYKQTERSE